MLEGDAALEPARIDRAGLVGDLRRRIEHVEEIPQLRRLQEQPVDEADHLLEPGDQHGREIHEGDDLADGREAIEVAARCRAEKSTSSVSVAEARVATAAIAHQDSTGIWASSTRVGDLLQRVGFGLDAREALDHRHIAERVGDMFGERTVVALDGLLQPFGAAQDDRRSARRRRRRAPMSTPARRQFSDSDIGSRMKSADEGGAILAEKGEPQAGHAVGALQHHFQQAAGMRAAVEAQRQMQDMLEELRHHREPAPVREALGLQGDADGDGNGEKREADPGRQQRNKIGRNETWLAARAPLSLSMTRPNRTGSANWAVASARLAKARKIAIRFSPPSRRSTRM